LRIVLGLGNEGSEYRGTRHNVGFEVADVLAERTGAAFSARGDLGRLAFTAPVEIAGERIVLAKPRTLMNLSGRAAAALCRRFTAEPADLIVVYDDADLALGRVRVRPEGGTGGHNGIRSLVDVLGTRAFPRVKLGVRGEGRDARDLADYVLDRFLPLEREPAARMVASGADAVEAVVSRGVADAQRAFNGDLAG
jgi:PTH1 family peptidyl-tRNA hydrolase